MWSSFTPIKLQLREKSLISEQLLDLGQFQYSDIIEGRTWFHSSIILKNAVKVDTIRLVLTSSSLSSSLLQILKIKITMFWSGSGLDTDAHMGTITQFSSQRRRRARVGGGGG